MPNNTISQVVVNNTTYDLLDANTLSAVSALKERVSTLESSVELYNINKFRIGYYQDDSYLQYLNLKLGTNEDYTMVAEPDKIYFFKNNQTNKILATYRREYQAGDIITLKSYTAAGFSTTGGTSMTFHIPLSQNLENNNISITSFKADIRQNGKYICPQNSSIDGGYQYVRNDYTVAGWRNTGGLEVLITNLSGSFPNITNNDTVTAHIYEAIITLL